MVKRKDSLKKSSVDFAALHAGEGAVSLTHILNAPEEMLGHGRTFAHAVLPVGAYFGSHRHQGEMEL